jgi:transcriptional regulator with XRE-family HTH domain
MREWLLKIRVDKSYTQSQMAKILQIPRSTYALFELGKRTPAPSKAKNLGKILGCNWTKFYEEEAE